MKKLTLLAILTLTGCATAQPKYYQGKHYMAGDADCAFMSETASDDVVMCYDKDMKSTGTRRAMSDIQVQAWYSKQEQSSSSSTTTVKCKSLTVFNAPITEHAYSCPIGTIPVR